MRGESSWRAELMPGRGLVHLDMRDSSVVELAAVRRIAQFFPELTNTDLGPDFEMFRPPSDGFFFQQLHQRLARAPPARVVDHRHAADPGHSRLDEDEAP